MLDSLELASLTTTPTPTPPPPPPRPFPPLLPPSSSGLRENHMDVPTISPAVLRNCSRILSKKLHAHIEDYSRNPRTCSGIRGETKEP
eukprot:686267-Pyramimonas_sp.AAC.1